MLTITTNWPEYFENHNEGLGTTYERFILHQYFENIKKRYSVQNILEVPSFGMTGISGINSMWWASQGVKATIVDQDKERINLTKNVWEEVSLKADFVFQNDNYKSLPFENNSFDMSWNFASLWFVPELDKFLKELDRVSRKVIFICIPNRTGLGHLMRLFAKKESDVPFYMDNIIPGNIKNIMQTLKWKVSDEGYFDVPPWPDIAMKKEDMLGAVGLKWLVKEKDNEEDNGICILDYFIGKKPDMENEILKYSFLEDSLKILKIFWAHHRYFVFEKES